MKKNLKIGSNMAKFQFKGLMAPVFTPFTQDKYLLFLNFSKILERKLENLYSKPFHFLHRKTIDYSVIEKYGQYLKTRGTLGVLVNGTVGEGTTLRIDERKRLAEEWLRVSRKQGFTMVLAIGGVGITDVFDLTEHAEKIGVDAIVLLPDLFYKPRVEEDMVEYVKTIVTYTNTTRPIMYYHIPEFTKVYCKYFPA